MKLFAWLRRKRSPKYTEAQIADARADLNRLAEYVSGPMDDKMRREIFEGMQFISSEYEIPVPRRFVSWYRG